MKSIWAFIKSIWMNHKKKIIALIIMLLSSMGLLSEDVRLAIHEATKPEVVEELPSAAPAEVKEEK